MTTTPMLSDPRYAGLILSRDAQFNANFYADPGTVWPDGDTHITFYDSSGGEITTVDGTVNGTIINYDCPPEDVNQIPAGAGFELFIVDEAGRPYKVRYGTVLRKEVFFPKAPAITVEKRALKFSDSFQRTALGSKWIHVPGGTTQTGTIWDAFFNLFGLGALFGWLGSGNATSAIRYHEPLNTDGSKVAFAVIYPSAGKTTVMQCADQLLTSYLGVQVDTHTEPAMLRIVSGNGDPYTVLIHDEASITVENYDVFWTYYDPITFTYSVYQKDDTTPIMNWPDDMRIVPHGPGHRYLGFSWQGAGLVTGPQVTDWVAQDDIGPGTIYVPAPEEGS